MLTDPKLRSQVDSLWDKFRLGGLHDYADVVQHQFEQYISTHNFTADQIRFLRAVQSVFMQRRRLEMADLYEPPLTSFGANAVERWFSDKEVSEIIDFTANLLAIGV